MTQFKLLTIPLYVRYIGAVGAVLVALSGRLFLSSVLSLHAPFLLQLGAVILSAWLGGLGPGLVATVLGAIGSGLLPTDPLQIDALRHREDGLALGLFILEGTLVSLLGSYLHRALRTAAAQAADLRRHSDDELRLLHERFRLAAAVSGVLFEYDLRRQAVSWSDGMEGLFGVDPKAESAAGDFWMARIHPDDLGAVVQSFVLAMQTGGPSNYSVECRMRHRDGQYLYVWNRGVVLRDEHGQALRLLGCIMDLTERRHVEMAHQFLAGVSKLLGDALNVPAGLLEVARLVVPRFADLCIIDLFDRQTGAARRVAALHVDPAKQDLLESISRRHAGHPGPWDAALQRREPLLIPAVSGEMLQSLAQSERDLHDLQALGVTSALAVPLLGHRGVMGLMMFGMGIESWRTFSQADLGLAQDLAQRAAIALDNARLYHELQEDDRRKDEFLAILSHELRNPLAAISTSGHLLLAGPVEADQARRLHELIDRQTRQVTRLVDDLLEISRIRRGKIQLRRQRLELQGLVRETVSVTAATLEAHGHRLTVDVPDEPLALLADPARVQQVLTNILHNAAKYTPDGGHIELRLLRDGDEAVLLVRDNGIGIPREQLTQIFDLFAQGAQSSREPNSGRGASPGGLGIGLAMVHSLVRLHGGSVVARSEGPGTGSEFEVRLPLYQPSAASPISNPGLIPAEAPRPAGQAEGGRSRILVVDDNRDAAETLALLTTMWGHEVRTATSGAAALETALDFQPGVVLLDIGMPGMDGYEVARRLRQQPPPTERPLRIIALTGYGQEEARRRIRAAGFDAHLVKPVEPDALEQLLRSS